MLAAPKNPEMKVKNTMKSIKQKFFNYKAKACTQSLSRHMTYVFNILFEFGDCPLIRVITIHFDFN